MCLIMLTVLRGALLLLSILAKTSSLNLKDTPECANLAERLGKSEKPVGLKSTVSVGQTILVLTIFGVFTAGIALLFQYVRRKVYLEKENLDTAFDAGGKVSIGLTATTIVSQWTWAATLLQSSAVTTQYGISGAFWYASGATVQLLLFSMLSVQLKIKAPGAKTFLQVVQARFGRSCHLVYTGFALLTNMIVTAMLMLGGAAVLTTLTENLNVELATMMITVVIGTYTFIGGLGATFYVSYFNTATLFIVIAIFIAKVYHDPQNPENPLGSTKAVFELISCQEAPDGNKHNSFLTILSQDGLMFGIINLVGNFGTVFVDQSYWQSSVAAKPKQGVWGFLAGGLVWFAVPFGFATTMGLAYLALSAKQGESLLASDDVKAGLVPPVVAQRLMGKTGEFAMLIMLTTAIVSTGSAEVIAVTSILVYDVYQVYLKPYRSFKDVNTCILCGRHRGRLSTPLDRCICQSKTICMTCHMDHRLESESTDVVKPEYRCTQHGKFKKYQQMIQRKKNWCLLWVILAIVPLTLILNALKVSLGWLYLFMGVLIGSAVVPLTLCMFWTGLTSTGMIVGGIGGCVLGFSSWLFVASTYPGGLSSESFMDNTGNEVSMLSGNVVSIFSGALLTIITSLCSSNVLLTSTLRKYVWESTRDIDNPLTPWAEMYARDLNLKAANQLENKPSLAKVEKTFRNVKLTAIILGFSFTLILTAIWPASMTAVGVMSERQFSHWIHVAESWVFIAGIFIIIAPVIHEYISIRKAKIEQSRAAMKRDLGLDLIQGAKSSNVSTLQKNRVTPLQGRSPTVSPLPSVSTHKDPVTQQTLKITADPEESNHEGN